MVLLEQYVTLYEKRWQNVFLGWKYFQITIYFITAIFGILASFCWTRLNFSFDDNCVLYGNVTFNNKADGPKGASDLNKDASHFGKDVFCSYCQYVPVCSVLFAALWMTFFTMCGRGGRSEHGLPQPWRIVYPAMIFNIVSFLFSLVAVVWYEDGYGKFCRLFKENNNKMKCANMLQKSCICICLLATVVAEWIKLPVLDPQTPYDPVNHYSHLAGSPSFLKVNSLSPVSRISSSVTDPSTITEIISFDNKHDLSEPVQNTIIKSQNEDSSKMIDPTRNKYMHDESTEIDTKFLQSVMNNSQKTDRSGLENNTTEIKTTPFFEILKNIHRTLLIETPTTISGKMKFLQDLQIKLYSYIKPRIRRLWNVDDRQARTEKGMSFPSMDGALMTICFLLFAVFLIKLVKQLIQHLQEKANANALMMTGATPMAAAPAPGRRKRSLSSDVYAAAHILNLIESFHVQYNKLAGTQ